MTIRYVNDAANVPMRANWDIGNFKITNLNQGTASGDAVHAGRAVNTGTGLSGGGNLTTDRTLTLDTSYTDGRYVLKTGDTMTGSLRVVDGLDIDSHGGAPEGAQINLKQAGSTGGGATNAWSLDVHGSNNFRIFYNGGDISLECKADTNRSVVAMSGSSAFAQSATTGFLYIPTIAPGAGNSPSGTPSAYRGVAFIYDTDNDKLWVYNGSWRSVALA